MENHALGTVKHVLNQNRYESGGLTMNTARRLISALMVLALFAVADFLVAYPLDGYEETGIRRVEGARLANEGLAKGGTQPAGAMRTTEQVDLRLLNNNISLPVFLIFIRIIHPVVRWC